jgi:hypothetical protein
MSAPVDLTPKEQTNVRTALKFLRTRCGQWNSLARALRFSQGSLSNVANGHKAVSPTLVFRIAKFASVMVDDVLTGKFPAPGTCPHCGHCAEVEQ